MSRFLLFFCVYFAVPVTYAGEGYLKTYGNPTDQAVIFLHGGPGGSSLDFELTTALPLAEKGLFVIVYDRRGEGRSYEDSADYSYQHSNHQLAAIYQQFGLRKAVLIGHSFGGIIAVRFAEKFPEKVSHLVLSATPFSLQRSFSTILMNAGKAAETSKDSILLKQIESAKAADQQSLQYSAACFALAMQTGAYTVKQPSPEAMNRYAALMHHEDLKTYTESLKALNYAPMVQPVTGFWKKEHYTTSEIADAVQNIRKKAIPVFGLYGQEDGLFDAVHYSQIMELLGKDRFKLISNASHTVYIDQQEIFIQALMEWIKA